MPEAVGGAARAGGQAPRVVLAEDHAAMAEQLRDLLEPEFSVVAIVGDGDALVDVAAQLAPDVIVCDVTMPGLDGISAAAEIRRRDPTARIVFVTVHANSAVVQEGLGVGALGYVLKITAGDELVPAVRAALLGQRFVSPGVRRERQDGPVTNDSPRDGRSPAPPA